MKALYLAAAADYAENETGSDTIGCVTHPIDDDVIAQLQALKELFSATATTGSEAFPLNMLTVMADRTQFWTYAVIDEDAGIPDKAIHNGWVDTWTLIEFDPDAFPDEERVEGWANKLRIDADGDIDFYCFAHDGDSRVESTSISIEKLTEAYTNRKKGTISHE